MDKYEELKTLVESMSEDIDKFYAKGNSSAGTRVRKTLQEVKKLSQELRVHVQETKNA